MSVAYQAEREEVRTAFTSSMGLLGGYVALLVASGFVLLNESSSTPGWVVALLPIPPLPLIAVAMLQNNAVTIRSLYLRRLEERLQTFVSPEVCPFPTPAGYRLGADAWEGRLGRLGQAVIYLPMAGLYVALVVESVRTAVHLNAAAVAYASLAGTVVVLAVLAALYVAQWKNEDVLRNFAASHGPAAKDASRD